jgi:hypothetical protein
MIELPTITLLPLNPVICGSRVLIVDDSMTILRVTARCDSYSALLFTLIQYLVYTYMSTSSDSASSSL